MPQIPERFAGQFLPGTELSDEQLPDLERIERLFEACEKAGALVDGLNPISEWNLYLAKHNLHNKLRPVPHTPEEGARELVECCESALALPNGLNILEASGVRVDRRYDPPTVLRLWRRALAIQEQLNWHCDAPPERPSQHEEFGKAVAALREWARTVRESPDYRCELKDGTWHVRYPGEAHNYLARGNQAIAWLAKLLATPNRLFTVADLRGDPEGKLAADAMLGAEPEQVRREIEGIKKQLDDIATITEDTGGSDATENEKANLLNRLKVLRTNRLDAQLRKDHANIATQLRKLRGKLMDDMPQLAAHLKASLKLEYPEVGYCPAAPSPSWKT